MTEGFDPARSLVLAVGIERYDYGPAMDLPGAAEQANRFAQWAKQCGVPAERVLLACSRLDGSPGPPSNVTSIGATREQLEKAIIGISRSHGDLLMMFWCGHGVLNEHDERALFTSDATSAHKTNLLVEEIRKYLSSSLITGFDRQIMLIDACANFVHDMTLDAGLPRNTLPRSRTRAVHQSTYYAAAHGQIARFDPTLRESVFSAAALQWLEQNSAGVLPPDYDALSRHVNGVFERLRETGLKQTPTSRHVYLYDDGTEQHSTPNIGDARSTTSDPNAMLLEIRKAFTAEAEKLVSPGTWEHEVRAEARKTALTVAWKGKEQQAQLGLKTLLQLRFRPAGRDTVGQLPNIRIGASGKEPLPTDLSGKLDDIAEVYRRTSGWLVILGKPGAGKSILARQLALQLIGTRKPDERRVPVVFDVHSWDPEVALNKWLTESLKRNFNGLRKTNADGKSLATALIEEEYILPILDGFDEIVKGLHKDALRELNHTSTPLVLISRTDAYAAAVQQGVALERAEVIVLDDLTLDDLRSYLPQTTQTEVVNRKWGPVLSRLAEQGDDLGGISALSSPLMVSLARAIYSDGPDDPAELLKDTTRFREPDSVKAHLLNRFVDTAYKRQRSRWKGKDAERWLGYLARRKGNGDFAWWELANSVPRRHRMVAFLVPSAILGATAGGLSLGWPGFIVGGLVVAALGALTGFTECPKPERMEFQLSGRAKHALVQVLPGVIGGLIVGIVGFFLVGQWGWWALVFAGALGNAVGGGLTGWARHRAWKKAKSILKEVGFGLLGGSAGGLAVGLIGEIANAPRGGYWALWPGAGFIVGLAFTPGAGLLAEPGVEKIVTPGALLKFNRSYALLQTIMVGGAYGLVLGVFTGVWNGTVFGCAIGVAFGVGAHAWGRWLIVGRIWLPLIGRLPFHRVWAFLEDAQFRGVLRQEGAVYAFRHALLRETLAERYAKDKQTRFWSD